MSYLAYPLRVAFRTRGVLALGLDSRVFLLIGLPTPLLAESSRKSSRRPTALRGDVPLRSALFEADAHFTWAWLLILGLALLPVTLVEVTKLVRKKFFPAMPSRATN